MAELGKPFVVPSRMPLWSYDAESLEVLYKVVPVLN